MKYLKSFVLKFGNETIVATTFAFAILVLYFHRYLGTAVLWISLLFILITCFYFTRMFYVSNNKLEGLYFFIITQGSLIGYFAVIYKTVGLLVASTNELTKPDWLDAFYFSVVTWTTLGYGDFLPSHAVKPFVMTQAILGYLFLGLLVGKVLFLFQRKESWIE